MEDKVFPVYIVNTVAADDLVMQGPKASAAIVSTLFF